MKFKFYKPSRITSRKFFDKSSYGDDWSKLSLEVRKRDNFTCQKCGYCQKTDKEKRRLEVDHKIPISKGGRNTLSNLWTLCIVCHKKKTNLSRKFVKNKF